MTAVLPFLGLAVLPLGGVTEIFYLGVKILAVAGGALAGFFLGPPVARLLVRLAFHRPTPPSVALVSRFVGAFVLGFLIYLIPIGGGQGGGGTGGGRGAGLGPGKDNPSTKDRGKPRPDKDRTTAKTPRKTEEPPPHVLAVQILGGAAVKQDRYYRVKMDGKAVDLTDEGVRKIIEEDRKQGKRLQRLEIQMDDDSVDATSRVVTDLEEMGKHYGLGVVRRIRVK